MSSCNVEKKNRYDKNHKNYSRCQYSDSLTRTIHTLLFTLNILYLIHSFYNFNKSYS